MSTDNLAALQQAVEAAGRELDDCIELFRDRRNALAAYTAAVRALARAEHDALKTHDADAREAYTAAAVRNARTGDRA